MLPIQLDPAKTNVILVGRGERAIARLDKLAADGVDPTAIFSDQPTGELAARAGADLRRCLPQADDLSGAHLLYIVDLPRELAQPLAERARAFGLLVNVEDDVALSNFHSPAVLRRGDLLLTVSTGGKSPTLARRIRDELAEQFGPEWEARLATLADRRQALRAAGHRMGDIASVSDAMIAAGRWLSS